MSSQFGSPQQQAIGIVQPAPMHGGAAPDGIIDGIQYIYTAAQAGSTNTYKNGVLYPNVQVGDAFIRSNGVWVWYFHYGTAQIQGLAQVHHDDTLIGTGVDTDNLLKVAKPAAETGAQVNPTDILKISLLDDNVASAVHNADIGFVKSDNTQWSDGDTSNINNVQISFYGATYGESISNPQTNLSAVSTQKIFDEAIANDQHILLQIQRQSDSHKFYIYTDNITKQSNYYNMLDLKIIDGKEYGSGSGYSWNIRIKKLNQNSVEELVDLDAKLSGYPTKVDLEGHESDLYGSYSNGSNSYWRGRISFYNQSSGVPDFANIVGQPDIADGTVTIALGAVLRKDKDPNNLVWSDEIPASDYKVGDEIYFPIWNQQTIYAKAVLTTVGTRTGTGDAAYNYFVASLDEVTDIPDVTEVGNYFGVYRREPSSLKIRLAASDIVGEDWIRDPTLDITSITQSTKLLIQDTDGSWKRASIAHLAEHIHPYTTEPRFIASTWETTQNEVNATNNRIAFATPISLTKTATLKWSVPDTIDLVDGGQIESSDIDEYFNVHHTIRIYTGSKVLSGIVTNFYKIGAGKDYYINLENAEHTGEAFTDGEAITVRLQSNLVNRDEFAQSAFLGAFTTGASTQTVTTSWVNVLTNLLSTSVVTITVFVDKDGGQMKSSTFEFNDVRTDSSVILEEGAPWYCHRRNLNSLQIKKDTGFTDTGKIRSIIHIA